MPLVAAGADVAASGPVIEEVVVTGSSIAQRADQSSLPVTVLTSEDIAKTGYTAITDVIQQLPAMQGFLTSSQSVNGGGGGQTTATLHALPGKYTLVLIDGQRTTSTNLNSIPMAAIERVEVLTDGASALYGADAIGGVVNFITKRNSTEGDLFYNSNMPDQSGGGSWSAGVSKGFGDLKGEDGYNILFTFSHDVQNKLQASQRAVSAQGAALPFSVGGTNYELFAPTSNTTPANVIISKLGVVYNPYLQANGNCGNANAFAFTDTSGTYCKFNYAATVQDIPSSVRDGGLLKGTFRVSDKTTVWAEAMVSQFDMVAQYAPPAQPLPVSPTQFPTLWNAYVVPYLQQNNIPDGTVTSAKLGYRVIPNGGRTDDWGYAQKHISIGFDSTTFDWDISGRAVYSHTRSTDTLAGGFTDFAQFYAAVASGAYDPVLGSGESAIAGATLHSQFTESDTTIREFNLNAQRKLFDLSGGPSVLSLGAEYVLTSQRVIPSALALSQSGYSTQPASLDYPIGGSYGQVPYEADRSNWGLFGEWLFPLRKDLTVNLSVRYDSYSKVHSDEVFGVTPDPVSGLINQIAPAELGNTFQDTTFKASFRYTPVEKVAIRGSIGTGFRAPALSDIAGALSFLGSTAGSYPCPFQGSVGCSPGNAQYDLIGGPNGLSGSAGLKPEKSTQWTVGVRVEPLEGLSVGADYWNVHLTNQIQSSGIAEQVGFNNPQQYAGLFINPYMDPAGFETIAFEQVPFNGGEAHYSGIDWSVNYRKDVSFGLLSADWTGTYMLKQDYNNGPGLPALTDLGVYGPDQQVVFRVLSQLFVTLQTGKWRNTISAHYKSGYRDQSYSAGDEVVFLRNADGSLGAPTDFAGINVPSFVTFDWQTGYELKKNILVTAGIKNFTDKAPPLSSQSGGGGNQIGYDGRYYDPTGRTYYAHFNFKF
jgi:iron complex outermembrane receptor protein